MGESKHSPTPWALEHHQRNPEYRIRAVVDAQGKTVCTFNRDSGHRSALRNGAVLVAAPDMLAEHQRNERVLTEALAALNDVRNWGENPKDARENLRLLLAEALRNSGRAIKAATGGET